MTQTEFDPEKLAQLWRDLDEMERAMKESEPDWLAISAEKEQFRALHEKAEKRATDFLVEKWPWALPEDDPRHGTRNGYNKLGCHCERCRAANLAYKRDYYDRKRLAKGRAPTGGKGRGRYQPITEGEISVAFSVRISEKTAFALDVYAMNVGKTPRDIVRAAIDREIFDDGIYGGGMERDEPA